MITIARFLSRTIEHGCAAAITAVVRIGTLPYYRVFYFNTLGVLQRIALHANDPNDLKVLLRLIKHWRVRKTAELQFISIACAVLAGAVIGSFSWYSINDAYWLASACWYASLVLSILGILLAAQQIAVFNFLGEIPDSESKIARKVADRYRPLLIENTPKINSKKKAPSLDTKAPRYRPKRTMVFVWQCPMMFMSYSVCLFLLGLTLVVITPLIRLREKGWGGSANAAIFYLAAAGVAGAAFVFCSFWIYHFVDFESDALLDETEVPSRTESRSCSENRLQGQPGEDLKAQRSSAYI